ncbi:hypothetical protein CG708_25645, partial [Salmonella enterica subsp. enterica serovar Typhimurium]
WVKGAGGPILPAVEMDDALNDAAAKGIDEQALKAVQREGRGNRKNEGGRGVEIVKKNESMNTAIGRLGGNEMKKVRKVAKRLAFDMKDTAAETAECMGQM